ncbi:MAG: alpha/beta fold hydrolase [Bradymonadia bacterium]
MSTHYIESRDGTQIAYERHGLSSGPVVVFANGLTTARFFWGPMLSQLRSRAQLITWDYKGHGASAPAHTKAGCSIPALVEDMARVMDACGVETATLIGFSMGGQVILEAWRTLSDRIDALVPILATPGRIFEHALKPVIGPTLHALVRFAPMPVWRAAFGGMGQIMRPDFAHDLGKVLGLLNDDAPRPVIKDYRTGFRRLDPPTLKAIIAGAHNHTTEDLLPTIKVPTLVVAGERDPFAPLWVGHKIHGAIPSAELMVVPDGGHVALVEQPDAVNRAVVDFLEQHGMLPRLS